MLNRKCWAKENKNAKKSSFPECDLDIIDGT